MEKGISLTEADLAELHGFLLDVPYRYAGPIVALIARAKAREQQSEKASESSQSRI